MLYQDFSTKLLGLQGIKITNVEETAGILQVSAELNRKPHKCPSCGAETSRIHDYRTQILRTSLLSGYTCRSICASADIAATVESALPRRIRGLQNIAEIRLV